MKFLVDILKNPLLKILVAPLSYIIFGLIVGVHQTIEIQWVSMCLLYVIVTSCQIIDQYFFVRFNKRQLSASPTIVLLVVEIILIIAVIWFVFQHHWIINLLLIIYVGFVHLQYFPFNFTQTFYHLILTVFFHSFILQTIAYFTQINSVTNDFLYALLPIVILTIGIQMELGVLREIIVGNTDKQSQFLNLLSPSMAIVALGLSVYFSLPSFSYYISQFVLVVVGILIILPLFVRTKQVNQAQNKINYFSSVMLIFNLLYAISYIY